MLRTLTEKCNQCIKTVFLSQVREKGHLNRPRIRYPFWYIRKNRTTHEEHISDENKSFIKELVQQDTQKSTSLIKTNEVQPIEWTPNARRCGVIARKIGQYPLWLKNGEKIQTTLLQIVDNHVVKYIPPELYQPAHKPSVVNLKKFGCIIVGAESTDPTLLTKEYCNVFKDTGVMPKKNIARFLVTPQAAIPVGTPLNVNHFRVGDFIDVRGKTVDHGFQGVVKRHGFKGMPASHGVTKTHRRPGNIGGGGEKGRVWPGTKLPGHMGNRWRILKGLRIWRINTKYNVMWVQSYAIPGPTNGLVYIYDTILPLRKPKTAPPFPTALETGDTKDTISSEDIWFDEVHDFRNDTIVFEPEKIK